MTGERGAIHLDCGADGGAEQKQLSGRAAGFSAALPLDMFVLVLGVDEAATL
jgi:hypothetical protein